MTNEEAIKTLHELWRTTNDPWYEKVYEMAINALKKEAWKEEHPVSPLLQKPALPAQPETHEERTETHACDCISRQAAIDALRTCYDTETVTMDDGDEYINYGYAIGEIEQLPSAQPDIIRCRNCKFASGDSRICMQFGHSPIGELDFCAWAERRTDDADANS